MSDVIQIQEQHTAGPQAIGFDYQFFYFMCVALEMKTGETVGFEVKDDIHIERANKKITLFQSKHTVLKNADGSPANLATLDSDLWKTLSNWTDMIKADANILSNHSFCLVTNKSEGNNQFINALTLFKEDSDIDKVIEKIKELRDKTENKELKAYIKNVSSLSKKLTKSFLANLSIETEIDDIIGRAKTILLEKRYDTAIVDAIFDSLFSNMSVAKYLDIKDRKKFEISFADFCKMFGKCFKVASEKDPLPKRNIPMVFPDKLEEQIFIKQLIDLGELDTTSPDILEFTTQMLEVLNYLTDWKDNYHVLPIEILGFESDSFLLWKNEFASKYRSIKNKINAGETCASLETEIKQLALDLLDYMKRQNISIAGENLGIKLSNGYCYSLSNEPKIGWHFDWEKKYKTA